MTEEAKLIRYIIKAMIRVGKTITTLFEKILEGKGHEI